MTILVNGEARAFAPGTTVAELLDALEVPGGARGVAIAVDAAVVPGANARASPLTRMVMPAPASQCPTATPSR